MGQKNIFFITGLIFSSFVFLRASSVGEQSPENRVPEFLDQQEESGVDPSTYCPLGLSGFGALVGSLETSNSELDGIELRNGLVYAVTSPLVRPGFSSQGSLYSEQKFLERDFSTQQDPVREVSEQTVSSGYNSPGRAYREAITPLPVNANQVSDSCWKNFLASLCCCLGQQ